MPTNKPKPAAKKAPAKPFQAAAQPAAGSAPVAPPSLPNKKSTPAIQLIRGMRDLLPVDQVYWKRISDVIEATAKAYAYDRLDTPMVEDHSLFLRGVGKQTDIVEKELFTWESAGGEQIALRPEGTAPAIRAYIQHGLWNQPQPVKLWYQGPMFRYDRPQAGRFRQFFQTGFECIGEADAVVDAQLIIISWNILKALDLDPVVRVNSLGTPESRANYKAALVSYFRSKKNHLSEEDKKRLLKNPLRLLDSKDPAMVELKAEAPQIVDWLDEESKAHFTRVLEYLDEVGVRYELDPYLVRGLDYYTKTVFEWYADSDDQDLAQSALGGGGRFDGLVEVLGGHPAPAAGFALGLDRIASRLKERDQSATAPSFVPSSMAPVDVFLAQLGDVGKKKALALFEEFRRAGILIGEAFSKSSIKAQMELANRRGAKWAIVVGQKEVLDGTAIIRDMDAGTQEIVDAKKVVHEVKKKLGLS